MTKRWVFDGHIAGIGMESGLRVVAGLWQQSPFGPFADAMVELPSGHRILLAPTAEVGDFIAEVYNFDETRVVDVAASRSGHRLRVYSLPGADPCRRRGPDKPGRLCQVIPRLGGRASAVAEAVSPLAARLSAGVRTAGAAKGGRQEYTA